ncbi:MAG TPA: penicillin-binding protein activator [Thermopetrobacter sp.]|nr:penicillin-binding protein activator [Thermopetrobacter sp.]
MMDRRRYVMATFEDEKRQSSGGVTRRGVLTSLGAVLLSGCAGGMDGLLPDFGNAPAAKPAKPVVPDTAGGTRVALLLPLGAGGAVGRIARSMKQAAQLAMIDAGNPGLTLVVKDTKGSAAGAAIAAKAALGEGARLILGPLLAAEVQAVAAARPASLPVIAFSSQSAVAGNGVYLMSFLPEEEVANVIRHAAARGKRRIAAMLPQSAYGRIVGRALKSAAARHGASIVREDYFVATPTGITSVAGRVAPQLGGRADALFLPAAPGLVKAAAAPLKAGGFDPARIQLLGTGLWDGRAIRTVGLAHGGWYAGVEPRLVDYFAAHFARTYGKRPPRIASLAYDATSLAIAAGRAGFSTSAIASPKGYQGMNGLFRLKPNGLIERGLAILSVGAAGPQVVAPPPQKFSS